MSKKIDLSGKTFGKLRVIEYCRSDNYGSAIWKCQCECGRITYVRASNLKSGRTAKCKICAVSKHGLSTTKIYKVWQGIKTRCSNPNAINYHNYGGRGIVYDPRWETFKTFYNDMSSGYKEGLTIERIDNSAGYFKDNCKWVTPKEQNENMRINVIMEYEGRSLGVKRISEMTKLLPTTIYNRNRRGWSVERIINTPVMSRFRNKLK